MFLIEPGDGMWHVGFMSKPEKEFPVRVSKLQRDFAALDSVLANAPEVDRELVAAALGLRECSSSDRLVVFDYVLRFDSWRTEYRRQLVERTRILIDDQSKSSPEFP